MDPQFFRKYADIITEAEHTPVQLDEGVMDTVTKYAKKLVQKASPGVMEKLSDLVSKALGKPVEQLTMADVTIGNAKKVLAANQQMSEAEEYQNPVYSQWDKGYERADVPGTLGQNQKSDSVIGGVVGLFAGSMTALAIPGLAVFGVTLMGLFAIAGVIIGYTMASPDKGLTGRFKSDSGKMYTHLRDFPNAEPKPLERDPRFDQNR